MAENQAQPLEFTDENIAKLELLDLMLTARGEGLEAVQAYAQAVFGVELPRHAREWVQHILENPRVSITAPPESAKTTVGLVVISWWIGKYPHLTNAVASAGMQAALDIAEQVAWTIENNERFQAVFPGIKPDKTRGWSREGWTVVDTTIEPQTWAMRTARRKDPTLMCAAVGSSSINGKRVSGILWLDDIHDRESKTSDSVCQDTVAFVQDTALPRATEEARVVIVQTRWNPRDVVAYVKTLPHFKVFEHPAIVKGSDGTDLSYWPKHWPLERLERRRSEIGTLVFDLVYQGNDQAATGSVLKGEWLIGFPFLLFRREWVRYFGIDFALTTLSLVGNKTRDPDRFALAVMAHTGEVLVVEDGFAGRVSQLEAEEKVLALAAIHNPRMIYLETNAAGEAFYQTLLRRTLEQGIRLPLVGQKAVKNKGERITQMQPDFEFGRVRVSDAATPFLKLFREEWVGFGNTGLHDDTLDAVYWAWLAAGHLLPASPLTVRRQRVRERYGNPFAELAEQVL